MFPPPFERSDRSTAAIVFSSSIRRPSDDIDGLVRFSGSPTPGIPGTAATSGEILASTPTVGRLCPEVPFQDHPVRSRCSATLIGEDLLVTAAHCVMGDSRGCDGTNCATGRPYTAIFNSPYVDDETLAPVHRDRDVYSSPALTARWQRTATLPVLLSRSPHSK